MSAEEAWVRGEQINKEPVWSFFQAGFALQNEVWKRARLSPAQQGDGRAVLEKFLEQEEGEESQRNREVISLLT